MSNKKRKMRGTVQKVIKPAVPSEPEKAQIAVGEADELLCFAKTRSRDCRTSASMTKFSVELKNQGIVAEIN